MLSLPIKRGDAVDLSSTLRSFLTSNGLVQMTAEADIASFQQIRSSALSVVEANEASRLALLRWNYHLKSLVPRMSAYLGSLNISFSWNDAFAPVRKISSRSLYFEWGSVLYNLAAIDSAQGVIVQRSDETGIRKAAKHFQQAANILLFLKANVYPHIDGVSSSDLGESGLNFSIALMLAQGQACFFEKAVMDKRQNSVTSMKPSLIAKLAGQAAQYYREACDALQSAGLKDVMDRSWGVMVEFQCQLFSCAAEFWQSEAVGEKARDTTTGYGEQIARLIHADDLANQALTTATNGRIPPMFSERVVELKAKIGRQRASCEQDNRTIYMESVPSVLSLSDPGKISMIQSNPELPEYYCKENGLFSSLLPRSVIDGMNDYRDKSRNLMNEMEALAHTETNQGRAMLASVGLPGSLESFKQGGALPDSLWKKVESIQKQGGFASLESRRSELEVASRRAEQSIAQIELSIANEERSDTDFRIRYPHFHGKQSATLNGDVRANLIHFHEIYCRAQGSDSALFQRFHDDDLMNQLRLLRGTRDELQSLLPRPSTSSPSRVDTSALEGKLVELVRLFQDRETHLKTMHELVDADKTEVFMAIATPTTPQPSMGLGLAAGIAPTRSSQSPLSIVESEMSRVRDVARLISDSVVRQNDVIPMIMSENERFEDSRRSDPLLQSRTNSISKMEQATASFHAISSQLTDGITFYSSLQTRLGSLLQSADDLAYTQQLLRRDFEVQSSSRSNDAVRDMDTHMSSLSMNQPSSSSSSSQYAMLMPQIAPRVDPQLTPVNGTAVQTPPSVSIQQQPQVQPQAAQEKKSFMSSIFGFKGEAKSVAATPVATPPTQPASNPFMMNPTVPPNPVGLQPAFNPSSISTYSSNMPWQAPPQAASQPAVNNSQMSQEAKISSLVDMGFTRDKVIASLQANNYDHIAALNGLLSSS